jgi:hypothetical protein
MISNQAAKLGDWRCLEGFFCQMFRKSEPDLGLFPGKPMVQFHQDMKRNLPDFVVP